MISDFITSAFSQRATPLVVWWGGVVIGRMEQREALVKKTRSDGGGCYEFATKLLLGLRISAFSLFPFGISFSSSASYLCLFSVSPELRRENRGALEDKSPGLGGFVSVFLVFLGFLSIR